MATTFGGTTIRIRDESSDGTIPIPSPIGSPIVRTPLVNGGTNIQVPGAKVMGVTYLLEFDDVTAFRTFRQTRIGTLATLVIERAGLTFTYPNTLLDGMQNALMDINGLVTAEATFSMDGY